MKKLLLATFLLCTGLANTAHAVDPELATRFARLALDCVHREYPNKIGHTMNSDADAGTPSQLHPVFYGCFDWHSSVHGHWLLVRLLRVGNLPDETRQEITAALDRSFNEMGVSGEVAYFEAEGRKAYERPYGSAWLLQLMAELREWDDPLVDKWQQTLTPLENAIVHQLKSWLPNLAYPIRLGTHNQSMFAFGLILDWAKAANELASGDEFALQVLGLLEAAEQLLTEGYTPRRGVVFAFGHDEEISGLHGAAAIAARMQELGLHFQWMVDEGGLVLIDNPLLPQRPMAMINVAEKGYLTVTLVAEGEGGHSSNPPQTSTIGRLSEALVRIESNPFPPRLVAPVEAMFTSLAPHVGQPESFIFGNLWLTGSLVAGSMAEDRLTLPFVRTTTALTMFNAGVKENVVPQQAEAKVNFRLLPGDTPEEVVSRIREIVDDPQIEISFQQWDNLPPVSDHEGPGFKVIGDAAKAVYPDAVVAPSLLVATTDTRHYTEVADDLYRFHGVKVQADQAKSIHGTNEFIAVDSYIKSIEVARQMLVLGSR